MDNIKELMKDVDGKYSLKEKQKIISDITDAVGQTNHIVICMEEMSELIEVIMLNINKKTDYIHTAEEIVDVMICTDIIKSIFGVGDDELSKPKYKKMSKNKTVYDCVIKLTNAQKNLSKYIRYKEGAHTKIVPTVDIMNECVERLTDVFKIKKSDIQKIETLKYLKQEHRLMNNTVH